MVEPNALRADLKECLRRLSEGKGEAPPGPPIPYMLRKSFVSVFIHLRVMARENPFRFEMMHRTPGNPTTVNRVRQPAAKMKIPIQSS
jgi:hypothetical protein